MNPNEVFASYEESKRKPRVACEVCGKLACLDWAYWKKVCDQCVESYWEKDKVKDRPSNTLTDRMLKIGIPERFTGCRFDNFEPIGRADTQAMSALRDIVKDSRPMGAYIHGSPGIGKTHLLAAMAAEFLQRGEFPRFAYVGNLIQAITDSWRSDSPSPLDKLSKASILLLDDLTFQTRPPEFVERELNTLINSIYDGNSQKLVVTSNVIPSALAPMLGDRFSSRICGLCTVVPISGTDHRIKRGKK